MARRPKKAKRVVDAEGNLVSGGNQVEETIPESPHTDTIIGEQDIAPEDIETIATPESTPAPPPQEQVQEAEFEDVPEEPIAHNTSSEPETHEASDEEKPHEETEEERRARIEKSNDEFRRVLLTPKEPEPEVASESVPHDEPTEHYAPPETHEASDEEDPHEEKGPTEPDEDRQDESWNHSKLDAGNPDLEHYGTDHHIDEEKKDLEDLPFVMRFKAQDKQMEKYESINKEYRDRLYYDVLTLYADLNPEEKEDLLREISADDPDLFAKINDIGDDSQKLKDEIEKYKDEIKEHKINNTMLSSQVDDLEADRFHHMQKIEDLKDQIHKFKMQRDANEAHSARNDVSLDETLAKDEHEESVKAPYTKALEDDVVDNTIKPAQRPSKRPDVVSSSTRTPNGTAPEDTQYTINRDLPRSAPLTQEGMQALSQQQDNADSLGTATTVNVKGRSLGFAPFVSMRDKMVRHTYRSGINDISECISKTRDYNSDIEAFNHEARRLGFTDIQNDQSLTTEQRQAKLNALYDRHPDFIRQAKRINEEYKNIPALHDRIANKIGAAKRGGLDTREAEGLFNDLYKDTKLQTPSVTPPHTGLGDMVKKLMESFKNLFQKLNNIFRKDPEITSSSSTPSMGM